MFLQLLWFELKYHSRQLVVVGSIAAFFGLGVLGTMANFGGYDVNINAPFAVAYYIALLTIFSLIVLTLISASALLRDERNRFQEILYTTTVTKRAYLGSKFCGIILVMLTVLCTSALGMLAGLLTAPPERLGPVSITHYIQPLFVFGVPNILFGAAILFATALTFRKTIAVFVAGALIYILYMVGSILGNSPLMANSTMDGSGAELLPTLLDPFGLVGFLGQARYWTPAERNVLGARPEGAFLLNRVLWTGFSLAIATTVYKLFAFRTIRQNRVRRKTSSPSLHQTTSAVTYLPVMPHWGTARASISAWLNKTLLETKVTIQSIPFAILMLLWLFLIFVTFSERIFSGPFNTSYFPTTDQIVGLILGPLNQLGSFLVIFYAGELVWSERASRIEELVDATPMSAFAKTFSKYATLVVITVLFILAGVIGGVSFQLSAGYTSIDVALYLSLFFYAGLPLACIGALAIGIQNFLNNKFTAILLTVALVLVLGQPRTWGLEHPLLRFGTMPFVSISDMTGFGYGSHAFKMFGIYWASLSAIILIVSAGFWRHGSPASLRNRLANLRIGSYGRNLVVLFGLTFFISGFGIYREMNVKESYQSRTQHLDSREEYERTYKIYSEYKHPTIMEVDVSVDLYPDEQRYTVRGSYTIVNTNAEDIRTLIMSVHPEVNHSVLKAGFADSVSVDDEFGIYLLRLDRPMAPGDSIIMAFELGVTRSGYSRYNSENSILPNGSYIELEDVLPRSGYNAELEIQDRDERTRRGLPPIREALTPEVAPITNYTPVSYSATISAPSDQRVVTVGKLEETSTDGDRTTYRFASPVPTTFQFAIALSDYEVSTAENGDIIYEVYYHDGHEKNVAQLLEYAQKSIALFEDIFGPYPYDYYRIAEIPDYVGAATAYPGVVFIREQVGFHLDTTDSSRVNTLQLLAAHETAHQWFAHQVQPAEIAGYPVLTETVAQYAELVFLDIYSDASSMRSHLASEHDFYMGRRSYLLQEPPLYRSGGPGQTHIYYQKGSLAMFALADRLGFDNINRALKDIITNHRAPGPRPTSLDLVESLTAVGDSTDLTTITDWFKTVPIYTLAIDDVRISPQSERGYEVEVNFQAGRSMLDETTGEEIAAALGEQVGIAFLRGHPETTNALNSPILLEKVDVREGRNTATFTLAEQPAYVVIDPFSFRPDRDRYDNIYRVKSQ